MTIYEIITGEFLVQVLLLKNPSLRRKQKISLINKQSILELSAITVLTYTQTQLSPYKHKQTVSQTPDHESQTPLSAAVHFHHVVCLVQSRWTPVL